METFPFILIRLAGLPFPRLSQPLTNPLNLLQAADEQLRDSKKQLIASLEQKKESLSNYFEKQVIVNLLKDLDQGRNIKFKNRFSFLKSIVPHLENYKKAKEDWEHAYNVLEKAFTRAQLNFHVQLKNMFEQEDFKSSLSLSSASAALNIEKFINAERVVLNKKLRQSASSALNFYTRASTKTSPFAGLGPVAWLGAKNEAQQVFKLNQVLLIYWEEYVLSQKELRAFLPFQLNPTISKSENILTYLVNDRNVEAIKKVSNQDLLNYVFENHSIEKRTISQWVNLLANMVDADQSTLLDFIEQLIGEGIFVPRMPCNREAKDWITSWITFFEEQDASVFTESLGLFKMTRTFLKTEPGSEIAKKEVHGQWQKMLRAKFDINIERLIYRDDYKKSVALEKQVVTEKFADEIQIINAILPFLDQLHFSKSRKAIQKIFDELQQDSIPLLTFYEHYHGYGKSREQSGINLENEINEFKIKSKRIKEKARIILAPQLSSESIHLGLADLENIFEDKQYSKNHFWLGALFQIGKELPFLRHTFPGHGKMMARFIVDDQVKNEILQIHKSKKDSLYVDHGDNSAFNANLHPKLTEYKIASIYPNATDIEEDVLSLQDLYIKKNNGALILWSERKQKRCVPINYGLEGLDRRSPLYQLIQQFSPQVPDIEWLPRFLKTVVAKKKPWGTFMPRIVLAHKLVIQRKQWILNKHTIESLLNPLGKNSTHKLSIQSPSSQTFLFYHILSFFEKSDIPTIAYFRLMEKETTSSKSKIDFRKPQFLNINEPDYFIRFLSFLKSGAQEIIIEEVYPLPEEEGIYSGHCQEWLVEYMLK